MKDIESDTIRWTLYSFLLVFYSNFVRNTYCISDILLQKCCDLENWITGLSR